MSADTKTCSVCGKDQPLDRYYSRGDGHGDGYRRDCIACFRAARNNWVARNRPVARNVRTDSPTTITVKNLTLRNVTINISGTATDAKPLADAIAAAIRKAQP